MYLPYETELLIFLTVNKHCHQSKARENDNRAKRKLILASVLCVIFMIAEIIGNEIERLLSSCINQYFRWLFIEQSRHSHRCSASVN